MTKLLQAETKVNLYLKDAGRSAPVLCFPMAHYGGELPALVLARSLDTGRALIAGTAFWGNPNMSAEADAVRVGPSVMRALQRPGEPFRERYHPTVVRRARLVDIAIHERGLGMPFLVALLCCAAAVMGAVAAFSTSEAPLGLGLSALVLACLAAVASAVKSIHDKLSAR
jgi:hypothetical protein